MPAKVNGQPGRVMRGPAEPPFSEADRMGAQQTQARLLAGTLDADRLAVLMKVARTAAEHQSEVRVVSVLTVDVVDGHIQAVRIVRNPDKLAHL